MLCQKCGLTKATVHRKTTVFRVEIQEHLCQMCAGVGSALEPSAESGVGRIRPRYKQIISAAAAPGPRPVPDRYPQNGLREVAPYVARFLASARSFAHLHVCSLDQARGFRLYSRNGEIVMYILVTDQRNNGEREKRIRDFFSALKIIPEADHLAEGNIRVLLYPLNDETGALSALCVRLLSVALLVTPEEGLDITFGEHGGG
jgi:hypothetical protein